MKPLHAAILVATLLGASPVFADVRLPAIISDHMVLQSDAEAAIWGWADASENVTVSIAGQTKSTPAGADGRWAVKLERLAATKEPQTLIVRGKNTLTVNDVLVGEVWLASGQSNMEMRIKDPMHGLVDNAEAEIAAAKSPEIRAFIYDQNLAIYELPTPPSTPSRDRPGKWQVCSPETVGGFSAMGYFFARDLHRQLDKPVGIITAAVGGTPIEAWTSVAAQEAEPKLRPVLEDWKRQLTDYDPTRQQQLFLDAKQAWLKTRAATTAAGQPAPKAPLPFKNLAVMAPGGLFNGLIAPVLPYTARGVIWYQGERNAAGPFTGLYGEQLKTLIGDWRARSGQDLYFAWVQLPRFKTEQKTPVEGKGWGVSVRDEMRRTLTVPHTGMAITLDLGGVTAGHPTNKADFATRLSRVVLHDVYAQPGELWTGPLYRSRQTDGSKMTITFDQGTGLKPAKGELQGFAIAGSDHKFVSASARITDGKVTVWNDSVPKPEAVRYGWASNPIANLVNAAGLPASPFRTDDWP